MTVVCLQGGNELTPACEEMDAHVLDLAGGGPVVVLPLAAEPGEPRRLTGDRAVAHYRRLGASDVRAGTDLAGAALVVLPGGSPRRLRDALTPDLAAAVAAAPVVSGASAGAMVLCDLMLVPDEDAVVAGIGLVRHLLVVPHFRDGDPRAAALLGRLPDDTDVLGLPECAGVLLDGDAMYAAGAEAPTLVTRDGASKLAL